MGTRADVVYIHGAWSGPEACKPLLGITERNDLVVTYDYRDWEKAVEVVLKQLKPDVNYHVVGHSLGGIIGWHVAANHPGVIGGCSIGSPWGGSLYASIIGATFMDLIYRDLRFLRCLDPLLEFTAKPKRDKVPCPWLNVVTQRPNTFPRSDGVVEVYSQNAIRQDGVTTSNINKGHHDVLSHRYLHDRLRKWFQVCEDWVS